MVECQTTTKQKIFPIFYDVEPSDVKHQGGSYDKAFRQHKKRFNEKTVREWTEAMREVGKLKGLELKKETDGHEGELAKRVVDMVWLSLKKNHTVVPDTLVGIDHHIENLKGLLNVDSNDVRIVGILGMGGIGKTTIAKVIYNQLSECFDCCCFLDDVREMSQHHNGLVGLQNQLISRILKVKSTNIVGVDEGITTIKDTVCRKKVLIVLDDVDKKSQVDKLAGMCHWYGSGSRIIVTTRNKEVLDQLEECRIYEPPLMNRDHSLKLFKMYAFRTDSPPEDYDILSWEAVSIAAGLPLVLVIVGSLLFGKDKAVWEDKLRKLQKIPHNDVRQKLKISYDALDYEQQQIFLDIACFFIGEDKRNPFYMWHDSEFYPTDSINVLVLRSLVKVGDDNRIRMHDQLRDLGRQIVREEDLNDPGKRSRLWRHEEALEVLESLTGTEKVVALSIEFILQPHLRPESPVYFTNEQFGQLRNLRFLRVRGAGIAGDFKHLLPNLRWFKWECLGNYTSITPINFHLKKLVILDLSGSNITDDWEGWSQIKMAKKLQVVDLTLCYGITKLPDVIGRLSSLSILSLGGTGICSLSTSICGLSRLQTLHLTDCHDLQSLPELPPSLTSLQVTKAKMETSPSVSNLMNMKELILAYCYGLTEIQGLGNLKLLTSLDVSWCKKLSKLDGIERLESLRDLKTVGCGSLERLPDLSKLNKLQKLNVRGCTKLIEIQGVHRLESLQYLHMEDCISIERLPDLSNLGMLKYLGLYNCEKLVKVESLEVLKSLESLDVSWCISLERPLDLSNLTNLKQLKMSGWMNSTDIRGVEDKESLEVLIVSDSKSKETKVMFKKHSFV